MNDVLDSLFSILPIVLVILWVLRRSTRKVVKKQEAAGKKAEGKKRPQPQQQTSAMKTKTSEELSPESSKGVQGAVGSVLSRISKIVQSAQESATPAPGGEEELYDRMESRKIEVPRAAVPTPKEATERVVAGAAPAGVSSVDSGYDAAVPGSLERISRLSPLAQGIIWSVILDEPVGVKEPRS